MRRIRDHLFLPVLKFCKPVLNDCQLLTRGLLFIALEHYETLAVSRNIIGIVKPFSTIRRNESPREELLRLAQHQRRLRLNVHRHDVVAPNKEQFVSAMTPPW